MDTSALTEDAEAALDRCSFGRDADRFEEPPALEDVYVVNTTREEEEPILLPLIEVNLSTTEAPPLQAVYRITAEIIGETHPVFREAHVRQYDLVFEFGETSLLDWQGERRLIAIRPRQADRLTREPEFDAAALRDRLEELDDGDDEIPPVAWGKAPKKWEYTDDDMSWLFMFGAGT